MGKAQAGRRRAGRDKKRWVDGGPGKTKPHGDEHPADTRASHRAAQSGTSLSHATSVSRSGLGIQAFPVTVAHHTGRRRGERWRGDGSGRVEGEMSTIPVARGLHSTATQGGRGAARPRKAIGVRSAPPALPPPPSTRRLAQPPLWRGQNAWGGEGHGTVRHAPSSVDNKPAARQRVFTMSARHDRKGRVNTVHLAGPLAEAAWGGGANLAAGRPDPR